MDITMQFASLKKSTVNNKLAAIKEIQTKVEQKKNSQPRSATLVSGFYFLM